MPKMDFDIPTPDFTPGASRARDSGTPVRASLPSDAYRENYDATFGKREEPEPPTTPSDEGDLL